MNSEFAVFVSRASQGSRIGALAIIAPVPVLSTIVVLGGQQSTVSQYLMLLSVVIVTVGLSGMMWWAASFMLVSESKVIVGFAPLSWVQIGVSEISSVTIVDVDPYAQYGGWGIKGSKKSELGRLYSAGGSRAVRVCTADGRTYLVGFRHQSSESEAARDTILKRIG